MSTVAIIPENKENDRTSYLAAAGTRHAVGESPGQALDALTERYPEVDCGSLIVVQNFRADQFFTAGQRDRLQELMEQWRQARDSGGELAAEQQQELEQLIADEVRASGRRAAEAAEGLDQ